MRLKTLVMRINMCHVTEQNLFCYLLFKQFCKYIKEYYKHYAVQ